MSHRSLTMVIDRENDKSRRVFSQKRFLLWIKLFQIGIDRVLLWISQFHILDTLLSHFRNWPKSGLVVPRVPFDGTGPENKQGTKRTYPRSCWNEDRASYFTHPYSYPGNPGHWNRRRSADNSSEWANVKQIAIGPSKLAHQVPNWLIISQSILSSSKTRALRTVPSRQLGNFQ